MPKLPVGLSARDVVKAIVRSGYEIDHQTGSHFQSRRSLKSLKRASIAKKFQDVILRQKNEPHRRITVPNHNEIAKGTLRAIIRQLGLTIDEFSRLL